jgi:hypothetical protein
MRVFAHQLGEILSALDARAERSWGPAWGWRTYVEVLPGEKISTFTATISATHS